MRTTTTTSTRTSTRRAFAGGLAGAAAIATTRGRLRAQTLTPIRAAITPVLYDAVPILYAQRTGMFVKAGIDLQLGRIPNGAAITAAIAGGSLDVGKSTFVPTVSAFARGIPLAVVAPGALYDSRSPNGALVVVKDSPIKAASDLAGKTVALNNLIDPVRQGMDAWLDQSGVDYHTVKYVEIPQSAQPAAADVGRVDAFTLTSPIMDEQLATGKYRIVYPVMSAIAPRWLFSSFTATRDWATKNKDAVKRFADVIVAAAATTNAHHGEMTALIADLTGATEASIAHMTWPTGGTALLVSDMQPVIDSCAKYGFIPKRFDARDMLFSTTT
jgi:NitT/TauT family transport system substrate-binding protein